jgi:hypothetical protein
MIVKNSVILKLVFVFLTALMIPMGCGHVEEPETVALQYLEACRDGDESTLARISIVKKPLTALRWRRITAESHRDDQGTVEDFGKEMGLYFNGKKRLLGISQRYRSLLNRRAGIDQETFEEEEGQLIAEMNSLLKQLEEIRMRHSGLFYLLEAGVLPQILEGRKIADFSGPYRAEIYFYVAEISSVSADVVKIQHQVKIELVRLSLEGFRTGWLVYKMNDLTE